MTINVHVDNLWYSMMAMDIISMTKTKSGSLPTCPNWGGLQLGIWAFIRGVGV